MRAAVLGATGRIEVRDVEPPDVGPGELLVELRSVGICGSDVHAFRGEHPFRRPPVVLGHEGAGRVVTAVPGGQRKAGDRVAVMPVLSCWECARCEEGLPHLCVRKRVPGAGWPGMLGEYVAASERLLFPVNDAVGDDEGAMIEPVAVACHAVRMGGVVPGQSVAVLGSGAIGGLVAGVCRLSGVDVLMASDVRERSLRAAEKLAGCHAVNASREDVVERGRKLCGEGFDVVVVASGHPGCLDEALALCRSRGTVVVLPMFGSPVRAGLNPVVLKEVVIRGSTIYTPADFRRAASLVNRRTLDVRPLLGDTTGLDDAQGVFEALDRGEDMLKVQVDPSR